MKSLGLRTGGYRVRRNEKGETELHRACIAGDIKAAERLLMKGHPVNEKDNGGWTCLHEACNWGHEDIARLLIEYGANIDAKGMDSITPLLDAAANGQFLNIDLLINAGASLAALDSEGNTVLDLLQSYKEAKKPLCNADEDDYKRITKVLEDRMRKAGIPLHRATSLPQSASSSTGSNSRPSRRSCTSSKPGVNLYTSAISSVGRSAAKKTGAVFDYESFSATRRSRLVSSTRSKPALVTETEYEVCDDWMIDDLNGHYIRSEDTDKKNKRSRICPGRSPSISEEMDCSTSNRDSPMLVNDDYYDPETSEIRNNDSHTGGVSDDELIVLSERTERKSPKRRRLRQSKLAVTPMLDEDSFAGAAAAINDNATVCSPAVEAHTSRAPVHAPDIARVNVVVAGQKFAVILDNRSRTIGWLAEKVSANYQSANGKRPIIRLFTADDAALSETDTVEFLFYRNEQLVGKVDRFDITPIEDNYNQVCQRMKQDSCRDIHDLLHDAAQSTYLDLRYTHVRGCGGSIAILKSLQSEYNLTVLNLRGQCLTTADATELGRTLTCLQHLSHLIISCAGMHCEHLLALSGEMCREPGKRYMLEKLDVSFNFLGDTSAVHLSRILLCCPLIKVLRLRFIGATARFITDHKAALREAFANISLEFLDMTGNRLGESVAELRSLLNALDRYVQLKFYR